MHCWIEYISKWAYQDVDRVKFKASSLKNIREYDSVTRSVPVCIYTSPGIAMIEFVVKLIFSVFLNMTLLVLFAVEPNHVLLFQFSPCLYDTCSFWN